MAQRRRAPSDRLAAPAGVQVAIRALDALSKTKEATLLRKKAEERLYEALLGSWATGNTWQMVEVFDLLGLLPDATYPPERLASMRKPVRAAARTGRPKAGDRGGYRDRRHP